jgi:CheY-like chemotaxis protein
MQVSLPNSNLPNILWRLYFKVKYSKARFKSSILLLISLLNKKSPNILLADDDAGSREIFIEAMEQIAPHIKVSVAVNGQKLMNALLAQTDVLPDIIFLDLNMPLKNGKECLIEIRNNYKLKDIPIIIYSTSSHDDHIEETFVGGANFYMIKPDSFNDLKVITKNILSLDWVKPIWPERKNFVLIPTQFK